jgi:MYXO-CTERM domain-containing protein
MALGTVPRRRIEVISTRRIWSGLAIVAAAAIAVPAQASFTFGFDGVTINDPDDTLIGETQFEMEVVDAGAGLADFFIRNLGPEQSTIEAVYFDGDIATGIDSIFNGPGVDFTLGGAPPDLPGGEMIDFMSDYHTTATPPPSMTGIDPGEELGVRISYSGIFDDLIAAISGSDLRVGLHAINFESGGSESFVSPTPGALALFALAGLAGGRRRRR